MWGIDDRRSNAGQDNKKKGALAGLYYQAEADTNTVKIGSAHDHLAVAVGDRIVVCYTQESSPDKVYFRVIRHGKSGPVSELAVGKGRKNNLSSEYMALYAESSRIWFVNTLAPNTLYELELVDAKLP